VSNAKKKRGTPLVLTDDAMRAIVVQIAAAYPAGHEFSRAEIRDVLHDVRVIALRRSRGIPRAPGIPLGARLKVGKRGQDVWRPILMMGANANRPPLQRYTEGLTKQYRNISGIAYNESAARARVAKPNADTATQAKGRITTAKVRALAAQHAHRGNGLASFIAKRLDITPHYVRRILRKI
jgi:hypothetical protein